MGCDGVKYFSGIAAYVKELDLAGDLFGSDKRLFLDLGRVRFLAEVHLNDQPVGIVWTPPFRVDITEAARAGQNRLAVKVANTWSNRLTGDARSPTGKRYTNTNVRWTADTPLLESGLLGPVRLLSARTESVTLG